MTKLIFVSEERKKSGTGSARDLRRKGKLPAIIYGAGQNYTVSLIYKELLKEYHKGGLLSRLVNIRLGEKILQVIPRDVQIDPISDNPIHADFQLVQDNTPITVNVRVKVVNQDKSPGIKKGGILNLVKKYIRLNCMPKDIPRYLEVDISGFEIGKNVHINNIKLPDGIITVDKNNFTILTIAGRVEEKDDDKKDSLDESSNDTKEKKDVIK
jgi:large subunit ribosomal protein L25